jgi:hypothetical protein
MPTVIAQAVEASSPFVRSGVTNGSPGMSAIRPFLRNEETLPGRHPMKRPVRYLPLDDASSFSLR